MYNITVAVEKNDEEGFMSKDSIRLVEVGGADSTHFNSPTRRYQCSTLQFDYRI